ncbi:MAG: hypothetical protein DRN12_00630 [Thermoplasmata archaeon]|nr:MAG: hypothetical protein DRN12_00630 [Thermoplasmata archaeon]
MGIINTTFLLTGVFLILFGFVALLNPNLAKWINTPGIYTPTLKSIICIVVGIIILILDLTISFPI